MTAIFVTTTIFYYNFFAIKLFNNFFLPQIHLFYYHNIFFSMRSPFFPQQRFYYNCFFTIITTYFYHNFFCHNNFFTSTFCNKFSPFFKHNDNFFLYQHNKNIFTKRNSFYKKNFYLPQFFLPQELRLPEHFPLP